MQSSRFEEILKAEVHLGHSWYYPDLNTHTVD